MNKAIWNIIVRVAVRRVHAGESVNDVLASYEAIGDNNLKKLAAILENELSA